MKIDIPTSLISVLEAYASRYNVSTQEAAKRLLDDLGAAFEQRTPSFLGITWQTLEKQQAVQAELASEELTEDQLALLEPSDKLASGYAAVYANGDGWRASSQKGKFLPTRKTPARAAWDRYLYFREHNLPYGPVNSLDETIVWLRGRMPNASEEDLKREAEELEMLKGGPVPQ